MGSKVRQLQMASVHDTKAEDLNLENGKRDSTMTQTEKLEEDGLTLLSITELSFSERQGHGSWTSGHRRVGGCSLRILDSKTLPRLTNGAQAGDGDQELRFHTNPPGNSESIGLQISEKHIPQSADRVSSDDCGKGHAQ